MNNEGVSAQPAQDYQPLGLAMLLREAHADRDLGPLGELLVAYAQEHENPHAWLDLSLVLQLRYQKAVAMEVQKQALAMQRVYRLQHGTSDQPLRLLALKAPGDLMANTPFECLLEGADVQVDALYVTDDLPLPTALPEHDVVLVAACSSDANAGVLKRIETLLELTRAPVINRPGQVTATERGTAFELLHAAPGIFMAPTARLARSELQPVCGGDTGPIERHGIAFPIIVRPVDSHAGKGLQRLDDPAALQAYLDEADAAVDAFYVASFIDYSDADGLYRKYRIVVIDGRPFLCHMGISRDWMVHYPYPEMLEFPERRGEESRAMADFHSGFAARHAEALSNVARLTGLDYVGLDCAEAPDGRLLIFEIATGMVVHDLDDADAFPYKGPNMSKVFDAFRAMLADAAGRAGA